MLSEYRKICSTITIIDFFLKKSVCCYPQDGAIFPPARLYRALWVAKYSYKIQYYRMKSKCFAI